MQSSGLTSYFLKKTRSSIKRHTVRFISEETFILTKKFSTKFHEMCIPQVAKSLCSNNWQYRSFSLIFSKTRVNTGKDLLERLYRRHYPHKLKSFGQKINLNTTTNQTIITCAANLRKYMKKSYTKTENKCIQIFKNYGDQQKIIFLLS